MRKNLVAKSSTALLMISILTACSQEEMPLLGQPGTEGDIRLEKALGLAESMISSLEDFYYGNGKVSGSPAKVGDNDSDVAIDYVFYNFRSIGTLTH